MMTSPEGKPQRRNSQGILLLANDQRGSEILTDLLHDDAVTVATSPSEMEALLQRHGYQLVIVTNFGFAPTQAISVIPPEHRYPAILITGVWDSELQTSCQRKRIILIQLPYDPDELLEQVKSVMAVGDAGGAAGDVI